ncbi:MAG: zinc ribbon domain-containing protein [Acidobacteria bacterium]|nr:zinc ribbon domain-containing protein [Acidobacteriota bacterium]
MPLYEYQCTECEATLEAIQAFSAPPLEECPECGRSSLKKLLSAPAFQFKGSGWYVNDYARKGNGNGDSKSNGDADHGKAAASETSSDQGKKASDSTSSSSKSETSSTTAAS